MSLVARKPTQQLVDLVGALGGKWSGQSALCRCPAHDDRSPSLSIRQGDRGFLVHCYAGCESADVLRELGRIVPGQRYDAPTWRDGRARPANIERIWNEGIETRGTLAETYLRKRSLPSDYPDIRFHPRCPHGPKPLTMFKPALLVAVRAGRQLTAIQRIFLDPATGAYTEKVMIGSPGQGAWQGAVPCDLLAIAESFEDAAAFMKLGHGPCWTSLGAGRLHLLTFPARVKTIIIAEDNDDEGRRASRRAWTDYRAKDLTVHRIKPPEPHKDWAAVNAAMQPKEERD
ncbi:MAG: toprim domain-containing protein [Sphingomonadaceae bacterium]|nr:toprim domain-containing protein [Sphingomonadaceae bacterium]